MQLSSWIKYIQGQHISHAVRTTGVSFCLRSGSGLQATPILALGSYVLLLPVNADLNWDFGLISTHDIETHVELRSIATADSKFANLLVLRVGTQTDKSWVSGVVDRWSGAPSLLESGCASCTLLLCNILPPSHPVLLTQLHYRLTRPASLTAHRACSNLTPSPVAPLLASTHVELDFYWAVWP